MRQSACELVRKDEPFNECRRCPLFDNRYTFVDEKELAENGILRPEEHIVIEE
ncbi:hypothetical protein [Agathobacter sp.]|uniref:hypothetical protein n=1 Tax=Agathobacter sp. TaxID=2021311 RepID=UPI002A9180F2|nr:hypothetical protein [Agathobacter sp.]MDY5861885.1 hypothetical protein [Agathobacter sp.]